MKSFKKFVSILGAAVMATATAVSFIGCNPDKPDPDKPDPENPTVQKYRPDVTPVVSDPETRPLVMSLATPDGVFNPFFSTSGYDSSVISMTQVSMLSSDYAGNIVCGEDEPTVVLDYDATYNPATDTTLYQFILKNGMQFSNGSPLTINDVLFNLYVYLDPVYTGSATIYSTKIKGLNAYRTQNPDATDKTASGFEESFIVEAGQHVDQLVSYMRYAGKYSATPTDPKPTPDDFGGLDKVDGFKDDFVYIAKEFRKELETDWNTTLDSLESYKDWGFTDAWQVYLFNDGGATELLQTDADGNYIKNELGYYQLDTAEAANFKANLDGFIESRGDEFETEDAAIREWAINYVYSSYFISAIVDDTYDETAFDKDRVDATIAATGANDFEMIARYWQTADTFLSKTAADLKSAYFDGKGMEVPTIEGIKVGAKRTTDFSGKQLGEEHDVLTIEIEEEDPKAIWNFAFTVAPLYYYSGVYKGVDYVEQFDYSRGNFGVKFGDSDFMNTVVNASSKIGVPVGAGPYMASTSNGGVAQSAGDFMNLNMIYYERNPYFYTMGEEIENAKIKYLRYRVVDTDQIINSIATHAIDIGDPSATQENIKTVETANIMHEEIYTSGYGYIGINPRFVPNINVRRAIIKAMDISTITREYYQGGLAELIYRSMSTTSWAYPKGATVYTSKNGTSYEFDSLGKDIEKLVEDAGYERVNGVYQKSLAGFGVDRLDYTFTIAGGTTDHPAYKVFQDAMQLLNRHGFAVKVVTSATALTDLTAGKLEVWAAAWSSTIDPDMYQVYHMDSQATSVNNWGYKYIKANKTLYSTEYGIIVDLSELIDAGRSTLDPSDRATIYSDALDLVMELAVELPTYQRKDMTAYDLAVIDENTLTPEAERSPYNGLFARIWEVNYYLTLPEAPETPAETPEA